MSMPTSSGRLRERVRPFLVALCAGGIYGSWAGFVHRGLGAGAAMCAGCTQVGLSMFTTLVFALLLERLFRWPSNPVRGFWLAALVSSTLGAAWLGVGHALVGTPHIAAAIAPSVIVGGVFDFVYAGRLLMLARRCAGVGRGVSNRGAIAVFARYLVTLESPA
jgi:hypothetical protein